MTYFGFLGLFLLTPLLILSGLTLRDRRRGVTLPVGLAGWPAWQVVVVHVIMALVYTTPWDNYLVATRVWWYDPGRVTGLTFGWVPVEEYTFFVLQPLFTGLWLLYLARHLSLDGEKTDSKYGYLRWLTTAVLAIIWLGAVVILLDGWRPGTYLALELGWALPPIMLQLAFGADILWRYRSLVLLGILPTTIYLALADAIAIGAGTWTINPAQSLNILLGHQLPVEELFFFLLTNTLLVFGMTLALVRESQGRLWSVKQHFIYGR